MGKRKQRDKAAEQRHWIQGILRRFLGNPDDPEGKPVIEAKAIKGGAFPKTALTDPNATPAPGERPSGKLAGLIHDNPDAVIKPQSFARVRERQVLRWISTAMLAIYPKGQEFQAAFHNGTVYIASNRDAQNARVALFFERHKGQIVKAIAKSVMTELGKLDGRKARHVAKMVSRSETEAYPEQSPILAALNAGNIVVPEAEGKERDGFHAERRLAQTIEACMSEAEKAVGKAAFKLGGVRRPCAICASALDLFDEMFVGPLWTSGAATIDHDLNEFLETLQRHVKNGDYAKVLTRYTEVEGKLPTDEWDEDSDSDIDAGAYAAAFEAADAFELEQSGGSDVEDSSDDEGGEEGDDEGEDDGDGDRRSRSRPSPQLKPRDRSPKRESTRGRK